ncbi:MAG: ferric reductase-like transmembrane domain-containing protein [Candidatus Paceibacterota bacterium]|jgi:predicted ferric reductase
MKKALLWLSVAIIVGIGLVVAYGALLQSNWLGALVDGITAHHPQNLPWYITRSAAITAYVLMFIVVVLGTGMTGGFVYRFINPIKAWTIHKYVSIALGVVVLVHIFSLFFDSFVHFGITELFVPLASSFKPVYVGMGIIGFYLLVITILVSIFLRIRTPRFWRATHYVVYPLFAFSFVHGVMTGTDSAVSAMVDMYWITGIIFILLMMYRIVGYVLHRRALARLRLAGDDA